MPFHTSLYLPEPVYEALRKIAFEERIKIHDVVLEGIDLALRLRGYPSIEGFKAGWLFCRVAFVPSRSPTPQAPLLIFHPDLPRQCYRHGHFLPATPFSKGILR